MVIVFKPVEIGDVTITPKRGCTIYTMPGECPHKKLEAQEAGEILICEDCGKQVSAWWALMRFARQVSDWKDSLDARAKEVAEAEQRTVILRAAQKVEEAWRRHKFLPCCPHCHAAIRPEDGFGREQMRIVSRNEKA
ncbi:MAG: hypothetical protein WBA09_22500 [Candidatus Acidiferrum sp.]